MSWLRLDDGFASHPKLAALTDRQHRVWVRTLCYCAKYENAELTAERLGEIPGFDGGVDGALMRVFLKARLVDLVAGTYLVHDWKHYQPKDKTGAERQNRWRSKHNDGVTNDVTNSALPRPVPSLEISTNSPELQQPAREPTEAEIVRERELRERSGWVDNIGQYTGCRFVRGTHELSAIYDPLGTEYPPQGWPHPRPTKAEIVAALQERKVVHA